MPKIACPTCDTMLDVDADMLGKQMRCGSCQNVFLATQSLKPSKSNRRDEDLELRSQRRYLDAPRKPKGLAITSMILGVIALLVGLTAAFSGVIGTACCCPFISWPFAALGSILSIAGLIFGFVSMKGDGKGYWITGLITSAIGLLLCLVIVILSILGIGWFAWKVKNATPTTFASPSTTTTASTRTTPTRPAASTATTSPTIPTKPKKLVTSPGNFKVVLDSFENNKRTAVIRVVRDLTGLGLIDASAFVNKLPGTVITDIDKASADAVKKLLEDAGAKATVQ